MKTRLLIILTAFLLLLLTCCEGGGRESPSTAKTGAQTAETSMETTSATTVSAPDSGHTKTADTSAPTTGETVPSRPNESTTSFETSAPTETPSTTETPTVETPTPTVETPTPTETPAEGLTVVRRGNKLSVAYNDAGAAGKEAAFILLSDRAAFDAWNNGGEIAPIDLDQATVGDDGVVRVTLAVPDGQPLPCYLFVCIGDAVIESEVN